MEDINITIASVNSPEDKAELLKKLLAIQGILKTHKEEQNIIIKNMTDDINKVLPRLANLVKEFGETEDE